MERFASDKRVGNAASNAPAPARHWSFDSGSCHRWDVAAMARYLRRPSLSRAGLMPEASPGLTLAAFASEERKLDEHRAELIHPPLRR